MKTFISYLIVITVFITCNDSSFGYQQIRSISDTGGLVPIVQGKPENTQEKAKSVIQKETPNTNQEQDTATKAPEPTVEQVQVESSCDCDQGSCDQGSCGEISHFPGIFLFGENSLLQRSNENRFFNLGGWIQAGYSSQSTGLFNNRPDRFEANQVWLYAEREVNDEQMLGFRIDALYGIDGSDTQAFGNPTGTWDFGNGLDHGGYSFAVPQAYLQIGTEDANLKVGHFFTTIGYETVMAPDNFFYSHAATMFNSEPFTHTGLLGQFKGPDDATVYAGWTFGWDTGFNQSAGGSSFLGGFSKDLAEGFNFTYMTTVGDFGNRGSGYSHSLVFDLALTDRLDYIVQSDLVSLDSSGNNNSEVGVNQYLIYELGDHWGLGTRFEWWKSDNTGASRSTYSVTTGLNYRPSEHFRIRPEVRYNWGAPIITGADMDTPIFAIDFVLQF